MEHPVDLSVVIPVYRSETILEELVIRLDKALSQMSREIILVNDCSPDQSWEKIKILSTKYSGLKGISLRKNFGYDCALMAGLNQCRGEYVVIMDDDLQHAPEDIAKLLSRAKAGCDVVYADFNAFHKKQSLLKNFGSWLNGKLAECIINKPPHIYLSPFKILAGELVQEITKYQGPYPYIDGLIFQNTNSIDQVPLPHYSRKEGRGNHGVIRSLKIMANFCTSHSVLPLRFAIFLGFFVSFCAALVGVALVYWKFVRTIDVEGWASTIFTILLMGGIQLLSLGILGEYLGRTYSNVSGHPQYVIKETT